MPGVQSFNNRLPRPQNFQGPTSPGQQAAPLISPMQMQCPPPPLLSPPQNGMPHFIPPNYQVRSGAVISFLYWLLYIYYSFQMT